MNYLAYYIMLCDRMPLFSVHISHSHAKTSLCYHGTTFFADELNSEKNGKIVSTWRTRKLNNVW